MDALSETLLTMRLSGRLCMIFERSAEWCYLKPRPRLVESKRPPLDRILAFTLVLDGSCTVLLPEQDPISGERDQLVLSRRHERQILASSPDASRRLEPEQVECEAPSPQVGLANKPTGDDLSGLTRLICGHLDCGADQLGFLTAKPYAVRLNGDARLCAWLRAMLNEAGSWEHVSRQPGAMSVVERIVELMLVEQVRRQLGASWH